MWNTSHPCFVEIESGLCILMMLKSEMINLSVVWHLMSSWALGWQAKAIYIFSLLFFSRICVGLFQFEKLIAFTLFVQSVFSRRFLCFRFYVAFLSGFACWSGRRANKNFIVLWFIWFRFGRFRAEFSHFSWPK